MKEGFKETIIMERALLVSLVQTVKMKSELQPISFKLLLERRINRTPEAAQRTEPTDSSGRGYTLRS